MLIKSANGHSCSHLPCFSLTSSTPLLICSSQTDRRLTNSGQGLHQTHSGAPGNFSRVESGKAASSSRCPASAPHQRFEPTRPPSGGKPGGSGLTERSLQEQAAARQIIDRTWKTVSEMLDQMSVEMALAETYRQGSGETQSELRLIQLEAEVTKKVVADRINSLDDGFLGGLEAYSTAMRRSNQEDLAAVQSIPHAQGLLQQLGGTADKLDGIRIEVLDQLTDKLPPEVRVLNTVTQLMDRNDRRGVIREAAKGGYGKLPKVDLTGLWLAANQVISDMEEAEALPDRRLLAMVCIVREEVQFVARELMRADSEFGDALKAQRNMLPPAALAFLQRLMQVGDPLQRQALLAKGFREEAKDKGVKPGQLMLCLGAMLDQLQVTDTDRADPQRVELLEHMQAEALRALQDVVEKG